MICMAQFTITNLYDGTAGSKGESIASVIHEFTVSTSSTKLINPEWSDPNTPEWSETAPPKGSIDENHFEWKRDKTVLTDGSIIYSNAVCEATISGVISDVNKNTKSITDKVWESDITTKINQYDGSTVSTIRDRVTKTEQDITGITTRVSDVESTTDNLGTRMTSAESSITQNADNINLKVSKDSVISEINASPESITISADKVNITGDVIVSKLSNANKDAISANAISKAEAAQSDASEAVSTANSANSTAQSAASDASNALSKANSSIKTDTLHYLATSASSGVTKNTSGWTTTIQNVDATNKYLWTYHTYTKADNTTTDTTPVITGVYGDKGGKGDTGTGITSVTPLYYGTNSTSTPAKPTSAVTVSSSTEYNKWNKTCPTWTTTYKYYFTCSEILYDNGTRKWSDVVRENALETANSTANTASTNANSALGKASTAETNASNALSKANNGIVEQKTLYYLTNSSAPSVPTSAVTSVSTSTGVWTTVIPTPKSGYTYYTCTQTKNGAGTYAWIGDANNKGVKMATDSTIANWCASADSTYINGGSIYANSITTNKLATDAIKSLNYTASQNTDSPYSATGTFLDLSTGNFYTPNFGIDNTYGKAYLNGEIIASSGQIGSDTTNYWEIGNKTDYNANDSAAIIGHGSSYIQSGGWMISADRIDTRSYDSNRKYTYPLNNNTYWDFGLHVPNLTSNEVYENNFIYIRNHESTIPTLEGNWNYLFRVDRDGGIEATGLKINGTTIQDMITAGVDGGAYLPTSGGTISGNLTVTGTITGLKTLSVNGKTYNGTVDVNVGVIGAAYGGTGQSSLINSANALINALSTGSSTPTDNDYYISQYVGGGTTTTTYHRRPMSALWTYIKSKINADTTLMTDKFVPKTGGEFTGAITVSDSFTADEATVGNLIVNGAGRFTNGLYGDLTGDVVGDLTGTATSASKLNSTRSFTVGKTAKNVDWSGAVSFSQAEISDVASTTANGWMDKDDKIKLNGIEAGAQVNTITGVKGNSESTYRTGNVNITAANIGLGNLTNNKQVKGLSSGTTSGHLVTWDSDGYTVTDSGIAKGNVATKITLAGTDYSASSNTITITKANLQSAVQDTNLVLMTTTERSKLSSIAVSEGGTIDFSGVTATAPITATVNQTTKAVNITHDTSGVTAGTYRSVTVNTYGHVTGGTNPTTLSGYGITDAKIASGVITLGSNTITPLTASSTLDATKLSGTASISITGNSSTTTEFSSNATITLTGDTTGTASSKKGWSIATTTKKVSSSSTSSLSDFIDSEAFIYTYAAGSNSITDKPTSVDAFGAFAFKTAAGWYGQLLISSNQASGIYWRTATNLSGSWKKILDSNNYTDYTVTKTGTGASGTWGISISGTATKATQDGSGNVIIDTYVNLTGAQTISGTKTFSATILSSAGICVNSGGSPSAGGVSFWSDKNVKSYGIALRSAADSGKHGYVQGDYAIYNYISAGTTGGQLTRGWVFKDAVRNQGVASISGAGNAVFDGSVTIGGNATNTSGCRQEYNATLDCLEFIFN